MRKRIYSFCKQKFDDLEDIEAQKFSFAEDFQKIIQATDLEVIRLSWTASMGREYLMKKYGKRSRLHLTDEQLIEFWQYLKALPTPQS